MGPIAIGVVALAVGAAIGAGLVAVLRVRSGGAAADAGSTARLEARLEVQSAELRRLADDARGRDDTAQRLRDAVEGAREAVHELGVRDEHRRAQQQLDSDVIRRLSTVLAGGASKGRAGENVLRQHLSELPPGMLVNEFRVNGKIVEFGLLLPDGRRLPIDSKWSALAELEALEAATDPAQREALAREVEKVVVARAREVAQYLDPALTAPLAVAAVPDAAYDVLRRAHADAFARGVVIVPYSSALPIVLFCYSLVQRYGDAGDVQGCLAELGAVFDLLEVSLENKIVRGATMVANGADEFRSQLGKARGSLARAKATVPDDASGGVLEIVQ
ncbi:MAG: DNA recombination protein RmuC [Actinomycetota bacterium]